jgi:hypothetical protein
MVLTNNNRIEKLSLQLASIWSSFEKFRREGSKALESVKDGNVGILQTKAGQYRILSEDDFQKLYGLARDVDRLRGGMRVVVSAARAVQKHPDSDTVNVLVESINLLGSLPELPIRESFEPINPEGLSVDSDDEVILSPEEIERPLDAI